MIHQEKVVMDLILCPDCGKQVSNEAESCPECGYPINPHVAEPEFRAYIHRMLTDCMILFVTLGSANAAE